jgi:hypothetical protein
MFSTLPLGVVGQSFALKGQYIPARRIAAGAVAPEINALKGQLINRFVES